MFVLMCVNVLECGILIVYCTCEPTLQDGRERWDRKWGEGLLTDECLWTQGEEGTEWSSSSLSRVISGEEVELS